MTEVIIYWALVIAGEPGFVGEIHQTYEPCRVQMEILQHSGVTASCVPTTYPEIQSATYQLKNLAKIMYQ